MKNSSLKEKVYIGDSKYVGDVDIIIPYKHKYTIKNIAAEIFCGTIIIIGALIGYAFELFYSLKSKMKNLLKK